MALTCLGGRSWELRGRWWRARQLSFQPPPSAPPEACRKAVRPYLPVLPRQLPPRNRGSDLGPLLPALSHPVSQIAQEMPPRSPCPDEPHLSTANPSPDIMQSYSPVVSEALEMVWLVAFHRLWDRPEPPFKTAAAVSACSPPAPTPPRPCWHFFLSPPLASAGVRGPLPTVRFV